MYVNVNSSSKEVDKIFVSSFCNLLWEGYPGYSCMIIVRKFNRIYYGFRRFTSKIRRWQVLCLRWRRQRRRCTAPNFYCTIESAGGLLSTKRQRAAWWERWLIPGNWLTLTFILLYAYRTASMDTCTSWKIDEMTLSR